MTVNTSPQGHDVVHEKMDEKLLKEPISTKSPEFLSFVQECLHESSHVVVLLRFANSGGAQDDFLIRNFDGFKKVLHGRSAKTAVTIFSNKSFCIRGIANENNRKKALKLWGKLDKKDENLAIIRTDTKAICLRGKYLSFLSSEDSVTDWFKENNGAPFIAGSMCFWEDNSDNAVTAYIPDSDNIVRPGAY